MRTIKIAGAGPAGLSAAITLAKKGFSVEVYERHSDVAQRFHGDYHGVENWSEQVDLLEDLQKMNININFICQPYSSVTISNGKRKKSLNYPKPLFYLVKRGAEEGSLDKGLKDQAIAAGAKIFFSQSIPEQEADIVAGGPLMGNIGAMDVGIIFKTTSPDTAISLLNDDVAIKGYSYLLVYQGCGCLFSCIFDDFGNGERYLEKTKKQFTELFGLDIIEPRRITGVGSFSLKGKINESDHLFVGEAAGFQDLLFGFGIRMSITSGYIAAQSIIERRSYEQLAKKKFQNKLNASVVNRFLWETICKFDNYSFTIANIGDTQRSLDIARSMYNYNAMQKLLYPIAYMYLRKRLIRK